MGCAPRGANRIGRDCIIGVAVGVSVALNRPTMTASLPIEAAAPTIRYAYKASLIGAALVLLAVLGTAMAGLLVRAIATGEFAGALFIVGFTALFGWQVGGFVRRNRPLAYSFDRLPEALLP